MATKLYFCYKDNELDFHPAPGNWSVFWDSNVALAAYGQLMDTEKLGLPMTVADSIMTQFTGPGTTRVLRGVSRKLEPSQTISGTINAMFHASQSAAGADCYTRMAAYIIDTTDEVTPTFVATLLATYEESSGGGGVEWDTSLSSSPSTFVSRQLQSAQAISSYAVPNDGNDYRIVVEIGCISYGAVAFTVRSRAGARDTDYVKMDDLTEGTGLTAAPYVEFSDDITFQDYDYPINHEPELAIEVAAGATTVPVTGIGDYTQTQYRWYKYPSTTDKMISVLFCSAGDPGSVPASIAAFSETDINVDGPPFLVGVTNVAKRSISVPILENGAAYFRTYLHPISSIDTTLDIEDGPSGTVITGDLFISADNGSVNLYDSTIGGDSSNSVFFNPTLGDIRAVSGKYPDTELGTTLSNGKWALVVQNIASGLKLIVYAAPPLLTEVARVTLSAAPVGMGSSFTDFYVSLDVATNVSQILKISDAAVIDAITWSIPVDSVGNGINQFGVARDGSVLYYTDYDFLAISRWDLVNDVALSRFDLDPAEEYPVDIIVMSDGSIVAHTEDGVLLHYSAAGALLHRVDNPDPGEFVDHICWEGTDSADLVWMWTQLSVGGTPTNRFNLVRLSTGAVENTFDSTLFSSGGTAPYDAGCAPPQRFGAQSSCPLLVMFAAAYVPPTPEEPIPSEVEPSGIYFINTEFAAQITVNNEIHETYWNRATTPVSSLERKIPNPTIRTALFGE